VRGCAPSPRVVKYRRVGLKVTDDKTGKTRAEWHRCAAGRALLLCVLTFTVELVAYAQEKELSIPTDRANIQESGARVLLPDSPKNKPTVPSRRLSFNARLIIYRHSITSPESIIRPALRAGISQARNEPPEWGQGGAGYSDRFISSYGSMLIGRTIRFGVAAIDHEDPRFHPSNETGFWRRVRSTTIHYFMTRTDSGSEIPTFSRFAGTYGAAFISNAWYPPSRADTSHALLRGSSALGASLGWDILQEFWPDIKNVLHHGR
jgi:hypothetical protein